MNKKILIIPIVIVISALSIIFIPIIDSYGTNNLDFRYKIASVTYGCSGIYGNYTDIHFDIEKNIINKILCASESTAIRVVGHYDLTVGKTYSIITGYKIEAGFFDPGAMQVLSITEIK